MRDQRHLQRFAVNARAELCSEIGGAVRRIVARTRDVSASGAYVYVDDADVNVGDRVSVVIQLSARGMEIIAESAGEACISGNGTVVRHDFDGVAVAFSRSLRFSGQPVRA
jgi:hypothetical protein